MATTEKRSIPHSKELVKTALDTGISKVTLFCSLIIEPEEAVKKYLPEPETKIKELIKEPRIQELKEKVGEPAAREEVIKELVNLSVKDLRDQIFNECKEEAKKKVDKVKDALRGIDKTYSRISWLSWFLLVLGIGFVVGAFLVSGYVLYIFFVTLNQLLNSIVPAFALFAILTSSPAIFTSLPTISTSIPWQQILAASGVIGGIGISSIITTFIKGSLKEVRDASVDEVQIDLLSNIFDKKIDNSLRVLELDLYKIKNKNTEKEKNEALDAQIRYYNREAQILEELIEGLQKYLQTPIKTED